MAEDRDAGGEWITGFTGEPFQVDADGNPIPNKESEPSSGGSSPNDRAGWDWDKAKGAFDDTDESSLGIGGNDDQVQKDIWDRMDRGEFGTGSETTPADAETIVD